MRLTSFLILSLIIITLFYLYYTTSMLFIITFLF
nr:MAG TPA: hypothetical protein [Bacteriophage sp.]